MVSSDRGQLLLVAGIMIGLVVVSTAVLLNVVVVPGDATAEGVSADAGAAHANFEPMQSDLARLFEYATTTGTYGEPLPFARGPDLARETATFGGVASNLSATSSGVLLNVSFVPSEGVRGQAAVQWGSAGPIETTASNGKEVVENGASVPSVWLNVSRGATGPTHLKLRVAGDTGSKWRLRVYRDRVEAERPDGTTVTCQNPGGWPTRVYLSKHVVDAHASGARCPQIQIAAGLEPPYDVRIINGQHFTGEFLVTTTRASQVHRPVGGTVESNVYVNPAFRVTYLSSDISYESTFAVYNETGR